MVEKDLANRKVKAASHAEVIIMLVTAHPQVKVLVMVKAAAKMVEKMVEKVRGYATLVIRQGTSREIAQKVQVKVKVRGKAMVKV